MGTTNISAIVVLLQRPLKSATRWWPRRFYIFLFFTYIPHLWNGAQCLDTEKQVPVSIIKLPEEMIML